MTGFGTAAGAVDGVEYVVEIRSVNNRYFRAVIKLPETWTSIEGEIEKLLREDLSRGSILLSLRMKVRQDLVAAKVNAHLLNSYIEQLRMLEVEANPTLRIDLAALMQLPGVCEAPEMEEICERTYDGLMSLIRQAVQKLLEMRSREGQEIRRDLLRRCDEINQQLAIVSQMAPQVVQDYHDRLRARVGELLRSSQVQLEPESLAREVALFAERCDVAEEITRLGVHLSHFAKAVDEPEPAGRKLDFLAQEMLREANTIGSKANDAQIAQAVVAMKTAIDRIKEQVQNVE